MIHCQWLIILGAKRSEPRPEVVFGRIDQSRLHRIGMDVVDLLPNHSATPIEGLQLIKEDLTAFRIGKDWCAVEEVTCYIVECAWEIEVGPFASHCEEAPLDRMRLG